METKKKVENYIREFFCRYLDCHFFYTSWTNKSEFIDTGIGFNFGWVARYGRQCTYCKKWVYKLPFLQSERKRLIHEANKKKKWLIY